MSKITLTATDGEVLTGRLPESWAQVPLAPYAALAAADSLPARVRAVAQLCGLPAELLLHDVRHYGAILNAAPWLFGELPAASAPVPSFTHLNVTYAHVGPLDTISAEQMEALLNFLAASEGKSLAAAPGLLAVLYCPTGQQQSATVVSAAQAAFATLPVSIAWPALGSFIRSSGACATSILSASALSAQATQLLDNLEASLRPTAGGFAHLIFEFAAQAGFDVDTARKKNALTILETCEYYRSQAAK